LAAKPKRVRRRPEDAKRLILDAAEACMAEHGPASLRLQDVARAAGVSHPTILHHFGSREGLVRALNRRTFEELKNLMIRQMPEAQSGHEGIRLTFAAYRNGLAQRVLWLLQSPSPPPPDSLPVFDEIVRSLHEMRLRFAMPGVKIDIADSRAIVHLTAIAAFGDAIIGPRLRQSSGAKEKNGSQRFEKWFSSLLDVYMRADAQHGAAEAARDVQGLSAKK
jgi:AcrR family transcriptional regulator